MRPNLDLECVFELRADLDEAVEVGETAWGVRRIIAIRGGEFEGRFVRGRVLAGGADWQLIRSDGIAELDARYTLETESGELIYVRNRGIRHGPEDVMSRLRAGESVDASLYYFRTVPTFETAARACAWLMRSIFVCSGARFSREVRLRFWRVL